MKKTKTLLAVALTLVLLLGIGTSAFAADAKYSATQKYIEAMAELDGAACEVKPDTTQLGGSTYEVVKVDYEGELSNYKSHFNVCFTEDGQAILFSMVILTFDEAKLADVLADVNEINASTTSVKLYVDTDRNAVMGEFYLLATEDSLLDISLYGTGVFIGFTDQVFEALADYAV